MNVTVLLAAVVLNPVPVMVTVVPTVPLAGVNELMVGEDPQLANSNRVRKWILLTPGKKLNILFMSFSFLWGECLDGVTLRYPKNVN